MEAWGGYGISSGVVDAAGFVQLPQLDLKVVVRGILAERVFRTGVQYTHYAGHRQAFVQVGETTIEVDEPLVPLINEVLLRGWVTTGSCQERPAGWDHGGKAYVDFLDIDAARLFCGVLDRLGEYSLLEPLQIKEHASSPIQVVGGRVFFMPCAIAVVSGYLHRERNAPCVKNNLSESTFV